MMRRFHYGREASLLAILLVLVLILGRESPEFLTWENLLAVTRHQAELGIVACGMTLVIMSGGIDLSVGSSAALAGVVLGSVWKSSGVLAAVTACLATGLACGWFNGWLVAVVRLTPLIATLASMALFRGLGMVISQARPFSDFPQAFAILGQGSLGSIPNQFILWLAVATASWIAVTRTRYGRYLVALGDNPRAAAFAALPIRAILFSVYATAGLLAALASMVFASRMSTAKADTGIGWELDAITAVVLGGTQITGGRGTMVGTFLGVLILGITRNGLSLAGVSSVGQTIVAGSLLIAAAVFNQRMAREAM
jgi:rhamnose transport system permease protein